VSDRVIGRVVHRLFERRLDEHASQDVVTAVVPALVRDEELVDAPPLADLAAEAARIYRAFRARDDVAALLASGTCHYEVPFSYVDPERPDVMVRGLVDCLVVRSDGTATVLEFKTGTTRPAHAEQVSAYVRALSAALPHLRISAKIMYSGANSG
jgi:RecB family exonuclease